MASAIRKRQRGGDPTTLREVRELPRDLDALIAGEALLTHVVVWIEPGHEDVDSALRRLSGEVYNLDSVLRSLRLSNEIQKMTRIVFGGEIAEARYWVEFAIWRLAYFLPRCERDRILDLGLTQKDLV